MNEEIERIRSKYYQKQIKENEKLNKILIDFQKKKLQLDFYRKFDLKSLIDMEECLDKLNHAEQNRKNVEIAIPIYVGLGVIVSKLFSSVQAEHAPLVAYIVSSLFLVIAISIILKTDSKRLNKTSEYSIRLKIIRDIIDEKRNIRVD